MTFVGYRNAIDDVMRIAFCNRALVVSFDRAAAWIADAGDRNAAHREVGGADAFYLAAVRGRIT